MGVLQNLFDRIQKGDGVPYEKGDEIAASIERGDVDTLVNGLLGDNIYVALCSACIIESQSFAQRALVVGDDAFNAKLIGGSFAAFQSFGEEPRLMGLVRNTLCNVRPRNVLYVRNWLARAAVTFKDTPRGRFLADIPIDKTLRAA